MEDWESLKKAFLVGELGTVSAASEVLGVHRATVIRNIDALEQSLEKKLFIRHAGGYTPTEAGRELIRVVKVVDEQLKGLNGRISGKESSLSGQLIVTSVEGLASLLLPSINLFGERYTKIQTRFIASEEILKLEYGEAHIALRPGPRPQTIDNVVIPFGKIQFGLFASNEYLEKYGRPRSHEDLKNHRFVSIGRQARTHFDRWIRDNIPKENIVLYVSSPFMLYQSIMNHAGIGPLASKIHHLTDNLVEVIETDEQWTVPLWLIVHKDMYRTEKVQAFLEVLEQNHPFKGELRE